MESNRSGIIEHKKSQEQDEGQIQESSEKALHKSTYKQYSGAFYPRVKTCQEFTRKALVWGVTVYDVTELTDNFH